MYSTVQRYFKFSTNYICSPVIDVGWVTFCFLSLKSITISLVLEIFKRGFEFAILKRDLKQAHVLPPHHVKGSLKQYHLHSLWYVCFLKELTKELVYKINVNRDKIHRWGALIEVIILSDIDPPTLICWILKLRKLVTQIRVPLSNENDFARVTG